eukprot:7727567-Pyramimonas_sp.AAC.1
MKMSDGLQKKLQAWEGYLGKQIPMRLVLALRPCAEPGLDCRRRAFSGPRGCCGEVGVQGRGADAKMSWLRGRSWGGCRAWAARPR